MMQFKKASRKSALPNNSEWKVIAGYEDTYQIHFRGVIRNKITGLLLSPGIGGAGYLTVALIGKSFSVHRLVALSFIDNIKNKKCVNHIDGIKTNNHFYNLEWMTSGENNSHAIRMGLKKSINPARGIIKMDLNGNEIERYRTSECIPGIRSGNICRAAKNKKYTAGGFKWKYIN
jgi:hypothetical protein